MTLMAPICYGCRHFNRVARTCAAYPQGIPKAIWESEADHRQSQPGDGGVRFEPVDQAAADYAAELFTEEPDEA